jgi:type I restriction enzyme R subunit
VRAVLTKSAPGERKTDEELDHAIRQIVSKALVTDQVVDIFAAAGLKKPDVSILSDEFLAEIRGLPQRNLAVELLRKLLAGEIKTRSRRNVVQARSFAELLEQAIRKYQNRAIETVQVIEELIGLAKDMRAASARGAQLGLSEDELAFYDALETNDSAVKVLGEPTLKKIARELVATGRSNVTIDWTLRENVRAQIRVLVRRILRKYGYRPTSRRRRRIPCSSRPRSCRRHGWRPKPYRYRCAPTARSRPLPHRLLTPIPRRSRGERLYRAAHFGPARRGDAPGKLIADGAGYGRT